MSGKNLMKICLFNTEVTVDLNYEILIGNTCYFNIYLDRDKFDSIIKFLNTKIDYITVTYVINNNISAENWYLNAPVIHYNKASLTVRGFKIPVTFEDCFNENDENKMKKIKMYKKNALIDFILNEDYIM